MWRSESHRNDTILDLLEAAHLSHGDRRLDRGLWTKSGPTALAIDYVRRGSPLSHGEQVILRAAFDLWNGSGGCKVADLLEVLDERNLRAVAAAILARDGEAPAEVHHG